MCISFVPFLSGRGFQRSWIHSHSIQGQKGLYNCPCENWALENTSTRWHHSVTLGHFVWAFELAVDHPYIVISGSKLSIFDGQVVQVWRQQLTANFYVCVCERERASECANFKEDMMTQQWNRKNLWIPKRSSTPMPNPLKMCTRYGLHSILLMKMPH